jgi:hypothetical protein
MQVLDFAIGREDLLKILFLSFLVNSSNAQDIAFD